jgi:MoaA/NifB/PqqE/SkfB family radical SAM enzyme
MQGRSVDDYQAPLFLAWQLTNRCQGRCITCCEESGPDKAWPDELSRTEALDLARRIADSGIAYVAFGGGEPLGAPHCWDLFERLAGSGIALKIETDGSRIDETAATRLVDLGVQCIQISVDGATIATYQHVRPGSSFDAAIAAIKRLTARGRAPQFVFVPNRFNVHEIVSAFDLAASLGCAAFVTGPMMRIGRAAAHWQQIACRDEDWRYAVDALTERAVSTRSATVLSIYPWDILTEMETRLEHPQAMLLVVPNGKVKLLNALPFAPADLRRDSLEDAWRAYRDAWRAPAVRKFVSRCRDNPALLGHANETWVMPVN